MDRSLLRLTFFGVALAGAAATAAGQGFQWPEAPKNLEALPASIKGRELGNLMRDFAMSLGVRCQHCHAPHEGHELDPMDLTTFDFASDANENKNKARDMIRMVQAINETLLAPLGEDRLEVRCITCHRGQPRPRQLADVLYEIIDTDGVEAAVASYHELRAKHYGGFSYDFSPGVLGALGERLIAQEKLDAAIRILSLENEQNPEFAYGYFLTATAYDKAGRRDEAIERMQTAVRLAPDAQRPFFRRALEEIESRER